MNSKSIVFLCFKSVKTIPLNFKDNTSIGLRLYGFALNNLIFLIKNKLSTCSLLPIALVETEAEIVDFGFHFVNTVVFRCVDQSKNIEIEAKLKTTQYYFFLNTNFLFVFVSLDSFYFTVYYCRCCC